MSKTTKTPAGMREINLPFPGFYYSGYSAAIDHAEEMFAEYAAQREVEQAREKVIEREKNQTLLPIDVSGEIEIDESRLVTASEFAELLLNHCDYRKVYHRVAEFYSEAFGIFARNELGLTSDFELSVMTSPREYNFTTDRLFALISEADVQIMFTRSAQDGHKTLARIIQDRCTSYDGFCSFYSNKIEVWLGTPVAEWDYNELGILLLAHAALCGFSRERIDDELYELTFSGNGEEDEARDAGMNWPAYEKALAELREKKATE